MMSAPTKAQVKQLTAQGCSAEDWTMVSFIGDVDVARIRGAHFIGTVTVGANRADVSVDGVTVPCGIFDATVADCTIGANVHIARIGGAVARYVISDDVVIQDVAALTVDAGATFGAGTELETVNEAGGRVVRLVPELSAQLAYLQAFRGHSAPLQDAIAKRVDAAVASARANHGTVGAHARILHCGSIKNVNIGAHTVVRGATLLENGTILSDVAHPTMVGEDVQAKHFVIAEGASVTGAAMLDKVFVGQASKVGKQFSAENCVFFANCEAFHGEAVSIFAGPYTVTHHKGTLLIAAGFSFYNAGSGTNQSNHMYKLGPVHQGVFERGTKTGSFAYVLHETHVGAFSVIIGKHYTNICTPDLPFSYIFERDGQSEIVPGMNLFSVGTVRDGEKWPKRDGRKARVRRDLITFGVFTPFTVEKMRAGRAALQRLSETTPADSTEVRYGGGVIKRMRFRNCGSIYAQAVTRYLNGRVLDRIEAVTARTWTEVQQALRAGGTLSEPLAWTDVGGLLMPLERLRALEGDIVSGVLKSLADVDARFAGIAASYDRDEWEYVCAAFVQDHGVAPYELSREQAQDLLAAYDTAASALHAKILDDSRKEFDAFARIGYGLGMTEDERMAEFTAVRGSAETNVVVQKLVKEQVAMTARSQHLKELLARL